MIVLKSVREIAKMRAAGLLVWQAHQRIRDLIKPGVTTAELDRVVEELFAEHDAQPLFKGVPGVVPFPSVTCISVNEEVVHGIPGPRVLETGDVVSVDTGCRWGGWCGDAAVTHAIGKISVEAQHLLQITNGVLDLAVERLATAQCWSEVAREMDDFVTDAGLAIVDKFVGHGIGREMHEPPQVPNYDMDDWSDEDFEIRPGLVLAIEPMVSIGEGDVRCLDDHWTQVTVDGSWAAHFEHTVAITKDGPRRLTGPPQPDEETPF